ncbi:MAG TPA: MATE family efflux transporter, partial [Ruminococcaceae bacterium]|nr:MATE family efflux transporter [Oscillospiraceae bacterium]
MKDNTKIFAEYKVPRAVAAMALPSMMGMLINIIYNLADTFFVGQTGDSNQVAAVSVSMPLFFFFLAIGNLFGIGGCAFISRSLGEGKKDKVKTISSFCIYGALVLGIFIGILFFFFREPLLYLVGASDNTIGFAKDYLKWVAVGAPFSVLSITVCNLVRGEGAAKISMVGSVLGQVVNVILDPIFILDSGDKLFGITLPFGLDMGVAGAAIATVLGNVFSVVFFLVYFLRGKSILSITPKRFSMKNGIAKGVINVGLPASLNNLLMSISNIIVNIVLVSYGDNAVAAMGVAMKANMLVIMLQIGLAQGVQPLIGYCYGAKNYTRMKKCMGFSIVCNIVIGTVMMLFYLVFRENVISMFIDDAEVVSLGVKMLTAIMSPGPVIGIMFVLNFAFQGMGKGIQSFILSVGRQGLVYIPLLFILNKLVGLDGIIWAQATADFVCVIMSIIMFIFVMKGINKKSSAEIAQ